MSADRQTRAVIEAVAAKHGVTMSDMLGRCVNRKAAWARQEAYVEIRARRPHLSLPSVGRLFGRDHSTVLHGIRRFQARASETGCSK